MTIEISIHNLFFMILRTEMYEVRDNEFPPMVFSFKPFGNIASNENDDQTSFFDIIGVITSPGSVVKQSRYMLIEVEISDERIKHDDTFLEQGIVDQTGVRVSREFDDLDVKSLGDVVCLELADLPFGSDIVEVSGKGFVSPDLSIKKKMKKVNVIENDDEAGLSYTQDLFGAD
ncbi:hypothetical protein SASPL_146524 [Salvia splendens]|uniref:Uncharacterized protein n=1 Tax=Salvia splendens TaxID=180675 RepID=A0A8X8Z5N0_SALSN|nr:hypothetical protein SASPL_146524 [Salvia splendens]